MPQQLTHAWFFFGDSLTPGVNDNLMPGGWVSRLAVLGRKAGLYEIPRATFYNLGARRHGTASVAARWRNELECRRIPGMELHIVFCVGVVDLAAPGGIQTETPTSVAGILAPVLDEASAIAPTLVISPPPVASQTVNGQLAELCRMQKSLCDKRGIPFADVHANLAASPVYMNDLSDDLHPGPRGCAFMAQTLLEQKCVRSFMEVER